jgi:hypothetical protein
MAAFERIRPLFRGATLWGSKSDAALRFARLLGRPNRAGLFSSGPLVLGGLDTIDVSAETSLFSIDHKPYDQVSSLFADLESLLAEQRTLPWETDGFKDRYTKVMTKAGFPYWRFKSS